jgi:predicted metal-dependent hydrolase
VLAGALQYADAVEAVALEDRRSYLQQHLRAATRDSLNPPVQAAA